MKRMGIQENKRLLEQKKKEMQQVMRDLIYHNLDTDSDGS